MEQTKSIYKKKLTCINNAKMPNLESAENQIWCITLPSNVETTTNIIIIKWLCTIEGEGGGCEFPIL